LQNKIGASRKDSGRVRRLWVDLEGSPRAWDSLLQLAIRYGLSSYDTCYLELALRKALPLATLDKALQRAATEVGVVVL